LFEDDSDVDVRAAAGSHAQDGGVLEFASMFDTLHARPDPHPGVPGGPGVLVDPEDDQKTTWDFFSAADSSEKKMKKKKKAALLSLRTLRKVRGHVLGAWALGLSLGEPAEEYQALLVHTVRCVLRLAALLHYTASVAATGKKNVSLGDGGGSRVSQLFGAFLVFLSWDAVRCGRRTSRLASVVELTQGLTQLLLSPLPPTGPPHLPRNPLTSQSIAAALRVVRQAGDSLDHTYTLQQRHVWTAANPPAPQGSSQEDKPSLLLLLWSSDVYRVPLLQDLRSGRSRRTIQSVPPPQRPSSR